MNPSAAGQIGHAANFQALIGAQNANGDSHRNNSVCLVSVELVPCAALPTIECEVAIWPMLELVGFGR